MDIIQELTEVFQYTQEECVQLLDKQLKMHRPIFHLFELRRGKPVRGLHKVTNKWKTLGVFLRNSFHATGCGILCKVRNVATYEYRFDDYLLFQKMDDVEMQVLLENEEDVDEPGVFVDETDEYNYDAVDATLSEIPGVNGDIEQSEFTD